MSTFPALTNWTDLDAVTALADADQVMITQAVGGVMVQRRGTLAQLRAKMVSAGENIVISGGGVITSSSAVWRNGSGAPSGLIGSYGDYYIDTVTNVFYQRLTGGWTAVGALNGGAGAVTITSGNATGLTNLSATNLSATNATLSNATMSYAAIASAAIDYAVITSGKVTGLSSLSATNLVATNAAVTNLTLSNTAIDYASIGAAAIADLTFTSARSGVDTIQPTLVPDAAHVVRDAAGRVALALGTGGLLEVRDASAVNLAAASAAVTYAGITTAVIANATVTAGSVTGLTKLGSASAAITDAVIANATIASAAIASAAIADLTFDSARSGVDALRSTLVPDAVHVVHDAAGGVALALGSDGLVEVLGVRSGADILRTTLVPDAAHVVRDSAGGTALAVDADGTLEVRAARIGTQAFRDGLVPGAAHVVRDEAGGVAMVIGLDGTLEAGTIAAATVKAGAVTIQDGLVPDSAYLVRDAAGGVVFAVGADGSVEAGAVKLRTPPPPADSVDVTAFGGVGDGRQGLFLATFSPGSSTLSIGRFSGAVSMASGSRRVVLTLAFGQNAGFSPEDVGLPIALSASGVALRGTITGYVSETTADLSFAAPSAIASASLAWPCFTAADAGKVLLLEGGNTSLSSASRGLRPHMAVIAIVAAGGFSVTLDANPGATSAGMPAFIAWGTDNTTALALAGQAALDQGKRVVWLPGGRLLWHAFSLCAGHASERTYLPAPSVDSTPSANATLWMGPGSGGMLTDTAGRRYPKRILSTHLPPPPPPEKTVALRSQAPRFAAASAPKVLVVGDSLAAGDPNLTSNAYSDEPLFELALALHNPAKTISFDVEAIGGTMFQSLTNPGSQPGSGKAWLWQWWLVEDGVWWTYAQRMPVTLATPDLYYLSFCGYNDAAAMHPIHLMALINRVRALPADGSGRPPDIILETGAARAVVNHSSFPHAFYIDMIGWAQKMIRGIAALRRLPCLDVDPHSWNAMAGFNNHRRDLRLAPAPQSAWPLSPSAPIVWNVECEDFSTWLRLDGASGSAIWTALGTLVVSLSPHPGNVLVLGTDAATGNLTVEVRVWGRTVPTTVAISSGSTTLVTSGHAAFTGNLAWAAARTRLTLGPSGPFAGAAGKCLLLPGQGLYGASDQRTFVHSVIDAQTAEVDDYPNHVDPGDVSSSIAATGTYRIGGAMFLPIDAEAGTDIVIDGAGPSGGPLRTRITGWTAYDQVTLADAASTAVSGAADVFLGQLAIPRTVTGVKALTDAGTQHFLDVSIRGTNLRVRYAGGTFSAAEPPRAVSAPVPRWGGRFCPTIRSTGSGTGSVNILNVMVDDDLPCMPEGTPWEIRGDGGRAAHGGGGPHSSATSAERFQRRVFDHQDLST